MKLLALLLLVVSGASAASATAGEREAQAYLDEQAAAGFSGAVLAVWHGEVVVDRGYGLADRARRIPVRQHTVFDIGSIMKLFTAAAVLRLAEEGSCGSATR